MANICVNIIRAEFSNEKDKNEFYNSVVKNVAVDHNLEDDKAGNSRFLLRGTYDTKWDPSIEEMDEIYEKIKDKKNTVIEIISYELDLIGFVRLFYNGNSRSYNCYSEVYKSNKTFENDTEKS